MEREKLRMKADVFKAIGSPVRLGIIEFLRDGEKCVCEIREHVGTEVSNVSKHLAVLRRNGIVADRREGLKIYYSLTMPCVLDFTRCVEEVLVSNIEGRRAVMMGIDGAAGGCCSGR